MVPTAAGSMARRFQLDLKRVRACSDTTVGAISFVRFGDEPLHPPRRAATESHIHDH